MTDFMKLARGRTCLVWLPGCNTGGESTVNAHFRALTLGAGAGLKPADWIAAHACNACHDAIDGRRQIDGYTKDMIRLAHTIGVLRTIQRLIDLGKIKL